MNLTNEQMEKLRAVSGLGKPVTITDKVTGEPFTLGVIEDVVSEFSDDENKFEIQRIRCTPSQAEQHGPHLYRITYYTIRTDGRACLGGQYSPILNESEFKSLISQLNQKGWLSK
jgi:hypothetical protein